MEAEGWPGQMWLLASGEVFAGRYEVLERVGSGGAGEVYRARDLTADAEVALKVLHEGGSPRALERLRRELRLVRELSHPGIVRVFDLGISHNRLYTVSRLLEGESLAGRLKSRGRLAPDEAERIVRGVLEALSAAHAAGVVHRDVKPANIFLATPEGAGAEQVVLLDFGLARHRDDPALTETGRFLGTPHYAAPEQALGVEEPTPATDLYAVGVVLWEMLAGRPPFHEGSQIEILRAHMEQPPPRPARALKNAPWRLRALVMKLLEKNPSRRPADALAALRWTDRLRWWVAAARSTRRLMRRPRAMGAGLVALLALSGLAAAAAWLLAPVAVEGDGRDLVWRTRVGHEVRTGPFDTPVRVAELDPASSTLFPRAWVGLRAPEGYDPLRGDQPGLPALTAVRYPLASPPGNKAAYASDLMRARDYSGLDAPLVPLSILPLDHLSRSGEATVATVLAQPPGWAGCIWLRAPGKGTTPLLHHWHPGYVLHVEPYRGDPDGTLTLLSAAFNNWSGPRPAVFGLPASVHAIGQAPPFVGPTRWFGRAGGWYTYLPQVDRSKHVALEVSKDRVVATLGGGKLRVALDPASGVPLDSEARSGLSRDAWERLREGLMTRLFQAASERDAGEPQLGAERLESYARQRPRDPIMASVAAYRAALLWQASAKTPQDRGAYDAARRAVELALEMDPAPGRVRLLAGELAARQGDSARLRELLVDRVRGDSIDMYRYEWVLANAVAGDAVPPDRLNRAWGGPQSSHWQLLLSIVLAVRLGDAGQLDACKELLAGLYEGYRWDVHYYWMARAMIEGPGDDPERALEWLAEVQEAEPAGWFLPVELLRLRARAAAGDAVPSGAIEEAIDREIGELEESATTELHALFMLHEARRDAAALGVRDPDPR
jgi:hypothetical protein